MGNRNEWIIGREGDIPVIDDYVSRRHAKLTKEADGFYIEDLASKGGVYVNEKKVRRKKINVRDNVRLGSRYLLDLEEIISNIPLSDAEFTEAFRQLKNLYETYNTTKVNIQSQSQGKMMLKRSIPMAVPGLMMIGATTFLGPAATIIGAVLSAAAMIGGSIWGSKEMQKMPMKMNELEEQFKIDYCCPSCKKPFGQTSWESLRRQGQCPYCKRKFNVK
ncbi:MAG: FHA domain-containing protein [Tannerella sp.]|jgi:ribosomal protein L37AE/L43A|nr:FHA domain-containing protein [Tannerella sp.]